MIANCQNNRRKRFPSPSTQAAKAKWIVAKAAEDDEEGDEG